MRGSEILVASVLSLSLLAAGAAQAMEIRQFDKMAVQDRSDYVASLVIGTQQVLIDEGKSDLADQIQKLFTTNLGRDEVSLGMVEFNRNVARARVADAERAAQDHNAHRLHVEDAWLVTLQKNNIPLSPEFVGGVRAINRNFRSKSPPMALPARPPRPAPPAASPPKPADDDPIGSGGFITPPAK